MAGVYGAYFRGVLFADRGMSRQPNSNQSVSVPRLFASPFALVILKILGATDESNLTQQTGFGSPEDWLVEEATIVFADVADSLRLIEQDEELNARRIRDLLLAVSALAKSKHGAQLLERRGDGVLLKFTNPSQALRAARDAHRLAAESSSPQDAEHQLMFRVGVHTARILSDTHAAYGTGLSTAARVTALAQPGETALSAAARDQLVDGLETQLIDLGDCIVKGSASPVRVFRAEPASSGGLSLPNTSPSANLRMATVAVLPFDVAGQPGEEMSLGDLLAEAIICRLSKAALLRVISRLSTSAIRHLGMPLKQVAAGLRTDYLVFGSVRADQGRLAVYVELLDGKSDQVVWAEQLSGTVQDLLNFESSLAHEIAGTVQSHIIDEQLGLLRQQPLPNLSSYTLYLGGLGLMHRQSKADFEQSRQIFDFLKSRHPRSAIPRAWLGKWHMLKVVQGWSESVEDDARLAGVEAARAMDIEPDNSLCATVRGVVHAYLNRNFQDAQACYDHALQQNPSDALAHLQQAAMSGWLGDSMRAIDHATQALQLSPLDPHLYFVHSLVAGALLGAGEYERAEQHALRSIQANCMHVATYKVLTMAQGLQGKSDAASRSAKQILRLSPDFTVTQFHHRAPWIAHPKLADFRHTLAEAGVPMN